MRLAITNTVFDVLQVNANMTNPQHDPPSLPLNAQKASFGEFLVKAKHTPSQGCVEMPCVFKEVKANQITTN